MLSANLPWYDYPELQPATDALWAAIAEELRSLGMPGVPAQLDRETPCRDSWHSPHFLMGQACGYDLVISAKEHLQYVATPCYTAPCSRGTNYRSYVIVRAEDSYRFLKDLRGLRCVINERTSHSGMNSLRCEIAPQAHGGHFFASVLESGSHRTSLKMLRDGGADVAAIDCVAFSLLSRSSPADTAGLRVIHRTHPVPAPPYVTSVHTPPAVVAQLREALSRAVARGELSSVRQSLMLDGVKVLSPSDYGIIQVQKECADLAGYIELQSPSRL